MTHDAAAPARAENAESKGRVQIVLPANVAPQMAPIRAQSTICIDVRHLLY